MTIDVLFIDGTERADGVYVSSRSLAAVFILQCCKKLNLDVVFVAEENSSRAKPNSLNDNIYQVLVENLCFKTSFRQRAECPTMIKNCTFPAVFIAEKSWCVVGLSASLRHVLKNIDTSFSTLAKMLLGFRGGCLQACAGVSVWTKFCEIEILEMLSNVYTNDYEHCSEICFPRDILRFERHLEHPPILHNALKHKQKKIKESTGDKVIISELMQMKLNELPNLEHHYAEGLDLTLADLLIYVSIYLVIQKLKPLIDFSIYSPLVTKWYELVKKMSFVQKAQPILDKVLQKASVVSLQQGTSIYLPQVSDESLYKSDPNRYKPCWRAFTNQKDIDKVFKKLDGLSVEIPSRINGHSIYIDDAIDWGSIPTSLTLDVPSSRFERKFQQLRNMIHSVMSIAKEGDRIIDFCSGSGHLGIFLAYYFPKCKIILAENKSNSLDRAFEMNKKNGFENVEFYQCNLDYFDGEFDIGVCLHACGVASDLVIQKCVEQRAAFVCCPCCYGGVQANHMLQYPRSNLYKEISIYLEDYLILSHAADQTHDSENLKTQQGVKCMTYVDSDRLIYAREKNYEICLTRMIPPTCSPKNHILIGKPRS